MADIENQAADPVPYIFVGSVDIAFGPIVAHDQLKSGLVASDGALKYASIEFVSGSSRGPPFNFGSTHQIRRRIYVIGGISHFSGPDQHDWSDFRAKLVALRSGNERASITLEGDTQELASYYRSLMGTSPRVIRDMWDNTFPGVPRPQGYPGFDDAYKKPVWADPYTRSGDPVFKNSARPYEPRRYEPPRYEAPRARAIP
jgi:hypothetical protein